MSNNKKRPISDIFKSKSSKKQVNITSNNEIIINSTPVKSNNIRLPTTPGQILNKSNDLLSKKGETIFNDNIHQHIRLDVLSRKIVDTPEFQRLCKLKQLGVCNYVFRGAVHTRFEHSIGVAHLAERVVNVLRDNQPELEITNSDVLCVKIAGLCHDLGHGPFSHLYDGVFIKRMHQKYHNNNEIHWHHEEGSIQMFRHILSKNNIRFVDYGLSSIDQLFIEEIIGGVEGNDRKGRDIRKHYLYDIVNNTRSGLDVDKLDYYQRDMKNSNVTFNNNFERIIQLGRVVPAEPINESVRYMSSNRIATNTNG